MKFSWKTLIGTLGIIAVFMLAGSRIVSQHGLQQELSGQVLRFHVRADDNSQDAQLLKLKVRNAVGGYLQKELEGAGSLEESRQIAQDKMGKIIEVAEQTLEKEGSSNTVSAKLATEWFPEKTYGELCFPQGNYEALVVEIGSGEGKNWWCVMYPNLCFSDTLYEVDEDGTKLREVVSEEEYRQLLNGKNYKISLRIRGKK